MKIRLVCLFYGFDVDVSNIEDEFLSTFGASAVKTLDDFVWWGQLNAFKEDGSTFLTQHSLRHNTTPAINMNTKTMRLFKFT